MPGNTLTLTTPSYDTAGARFGGGALSGGYGFAATGFKAPTWTADCWVKGTTVPSSATAIMAFSAPSGSAYLYGYLGTTGATGQIFLQLLTTVNATTQIIATAAIYDGAWHHLRAVINGPSGILLFVDGISVGTVSSGGSSNTFGVTPYPAEICFKNGNDGSAEWPNEIDEAAFWPYVTNTVNFTPPTAAYTGGEGMTGLYHFNGNGNDSSVPAPAPFNIIAPDNAAISYVGNGSVWRVGASAAQTINAGNPVRCQFTGISCALTFDVSGNATPFPQIWYSIDGQPEVQATIAATVALTMPAATKAWPLHTLAWSVKSTSEFVSRWSPQSSAVIFTGLAIASGSTVSALPPRPGRPIIFFTDSIGEGYHTINANNGTNAGNYDTDGSDASISWIKYVGEQIGIEPINCGFGGQGLTTSGQGGVPAFVTAVASMWAGQARSFAGLAGAVIMQCGNDSYTPVAPATIQTNYQNVLTYLLSVMPANTPIACLVEFDQAYPAQVAAAVAAVSNPRVHVIQTAGMFDTAMSVDGVHPLGVANAQIAPQLGPLLSAIFNPRGVANRSQYF